MPLRPCGSSCRSKAGNLVKATSSSSELESCEKAEALASVLCRTRSTTFFRTSFSKNHLSAARSGSMLPAFAPGYNHSVEVFFLNGAMA